ncbi:MAG: hypothetical protein AB7S52_08955 [Sphaerochaetaceae bacterium]
MSLLALGLIAGGAIGLINGASKARQREADYEDKLEDLNRQKTILDTQFNQAKESHELATTQAKQQVSEANQELTLLGQETLDNRGMSLAQTSKAGSMQSEINAMQLATLAVQNTQQTGEVRQQAATSGFRGTASALNLVDNAKRSARSTTAQAKMQSKLSNYQTYASAVGNYTSATQQADAYTRKIEQNKNDLDRQLATLDQKLSQADEMYQLEGGYIGSDIEYLKTEGKKALGAAQWWDVTGGMLNGALSGGSMFA